MRLLEIILVIMTILCSVLWIMRKGTARLKFLLTLATGVLGVVQLLVEGYRTPMLPMYILLGGLLIYAGICWWRPVISPAKRGVLRGFLVVFFVCYLLLAATLPLLLPVFQLEKPVGPFAVGTKSFSWKYYSDGKIADSVVTEETVLTAQFWYPAKLVNGGQAVPYATAQTLHAAAEESGIPDFVVDNLKLVKTAAVQDAPVASRKVSYPVIIFTPGERVPVLAYSGMLQDLASRGFIVVSIGVVEPRLEASLVTSQRTADRAVSGFWLPKISFVLDHLEQVNQDTQGKEVLAGKLDLQHIGILGHSYGGTAIPLALQQDTRLKAGIDMDGIFYGAAQINNGVGKPFLYMNTVSSRQGYSAQVIGGGETQYQAYREILARRSAVLKHGGYELTINGILHLGFSDFDRYSPVMALFNSLDQTQADTIISSYASGFFQQYLEQEPSSLLVPGSQPFPQAILRQEG